MDLNGGTGAGGQQQQTLTKHWPGDRRSAEDDDEVKIGD